MVTSPNKGLELQVTGTNVDQWGNILNASVFTILDNNLGGITTKSLTNLPVDLTAPESQNLRLVLNGTLTSNVLVQTLAVGMTIIENNCTGNFTVTFRKNGVGAAIAIPNGTNNLVTTGASGNPENIGTDFPTGTRLPFQQTTPPAGWSKDTATAGLNNSGMRIVTGSVVGGGNQDYDDVFTTKTPTGTVGNTALSSSQIPSHTHKLVALFNSGTAIAINDQLANFGNPGGGGNQYNLGGTVVDATLGNSGPTGGGQVHSHGLTMNGINLQLRFFDFTIGIKI